MEALKEIWHGSQNTFGCVCCGDRGSSVVSGRFLPDQPSLSLMLHEKEQSLATGHWEGRVLMVAGDRLDDQ